MALLTSYEIKMKTLFNLFVLVVSSGEFTLSPNHQSPVLRSNSSPSTLFLPIQPNWAESEQMNTIAMFANKKQGAHVVPNKSNILPRQGYLMLRHFLYDCPDKDTLFRVQLFNVLGTAVEVHGVIFLTKRPRP